MFYCRVVTEAGSNHTIFGYLGQLLTWLAIPLFFVSYAAVVVVVAAIAVNVALSVVYL